jgi:hypothetical protein
MLRRINDEHGTDAEAALFGDLSAFICAYEKDHNPPLDAEVERWFQQVRALGLDHPEQTVWRKDATVLAFHTDTDSIEIDLLQLAGATLQIHSRIDN